MKTAIHLASVVVFLSGAVVTAETRAFTESASGRTINAEVVSATADNVTLKLDSGATHTLPLSRLSGPDREFVASWLKANPGAQAASPAAPMPAFKVEWTPVRIGRKLRTSDKIDSNPARVTPEEYKASGGRSFYEEWVCRFKITNPGRTQLANLKVNYELCLREEKKAITFSRVQRGMVMVPILDAFKTANVDTPPHKLWATMILNTTIGTGSQGQAVTSTLSKEIRIEEIVGVTVTLEHNGVQVHKFESPEVRNLVKRP